jgi:hypothetical protein
MRCSRFPKTAVPSSPAATALRYHGWNDIHKVSTVNIAGERPIFARAPTVNAFETTADARDVFRSIEGRRHPSSAAVA